jgi:CheY-like chemotaxis protein
MAENRFNVAPTGGFLMAPIIPLNLMIVDDNLDATQSLADLLERGSDHRVLVMEAPCRCAGGAWQEATQVFILDIGLPVMNG